MNIILIYFALKYNGDWDAIYRALEEKEKVSLQEIKELEVKIKEEGWETITILDLDYPNKLKEAYKPPFVIWTKGNRKIFDNKFIVASGNEVDDLTKQRIENFVPEIEKCHTLLIPGFAGVDQDVLIHSQAGKLYILACGLDKETELVLGKDDLFITEYPPMCDRGKEHYRSRNRLIAAFAESLVLFSSKKDGPMNNMVSNFLNQGKEIYCFPGNGNDEDGNSDLIKQGANLITSIKDISN